MFWTGINKAICQRLHECCSVPLLKLAAKCKVFMLGKQCQHCGPMTEQTFSELSHSSCAERLYRIRIIFYHTIRCVTLIVGLLLYEHGGRPNQ